jgi:hypothetical protein
MQAKDVMHRLIEFGNHLIREYVEDLGEADLLVRVVPGSNHAAWQLGHLIAGTRRVLANLGQAAPALPAGFEAAHSRETATSDDRARFASKAEYLGLLGQMETASHAAVDATPDATLDQPGPEPMRQFAPTVGSALMLLGGHLLMHAGQFVPLRRKLGKAFKF